MPWAAAAAKIGRARARLSSMLQLVFLREKVSLAAVNTATFYLYAGLTFGVAIIFIVIATFYKERELQFTSK